MTVLLRSFTIVWATEKEVIRSWPDSSVGAAPWQPQAPCAGSIHMGTSDWWPRATAGHSKGRKVQCKKPPLWGQTFPWEQSCSTAPAIWTARADIAGAVPTLKRHFCVRMATSSIWVLGGGVFVYPRGLLPGVLSIWPWNKCSFRGCLTTTTTSFREQPNISYTLLNISSQKREKKKTPC